jgi:hypothetical protein
MNNERWQKKRKLEEAQGQKKLQRTEPQSMASQQPLLATTHQPNSIQQDYGARDHDFPMGDETAHLKTKAPVGVGPRERGSLKVSKTSAGVCATGASAEASSICGVLQRSSPLSQVAVDSAAFDHDYPMGDETAHLKTKAPVGIGPRERGYLKVAKISAGSSATGASAEVFSSLAQAAIEEPSPAESSMDERVVYRPHPDDNDITDL